MQIDQTISPPRNAPHLLIVDDDSIAVLALRRAARKLSMPAEISVARDGIEALEILRGALGAPDAGRKMMVLLDINMPRMDGHEFLCALRADPDLAQTVVFVLSTSDTEEDIDRAYARNVAGYVVKSEPSASAVDTLSLVTEYFDQVTFPTG